jgi:hypothetical protein
MEESARLQYISVGGNRHPAAADWTGNNGGIVAFGAGNNIALWNPLVCLYHVYCVRSFCI